ncbi:hypothetical protein D7X55_22720 [Corallococcus sp. AB049A]|uniref:hypothetical protein n=1 Tax=Corallococcus sp. AB049A TaxID=2316721 RepID=UPI000EDE2856|nr:hypothetical protein [Corallococcus sp. AB049A]RKI61824.1 hypothetical protein D7X55_22720 [Corallococcus sp. AB049A]
MKIQFRVPTQSQPLQEHKPILARVEPPPPRQVAPNPFQQQRNQDLFTPTPRTRQTQLLGGGTTFQAFTPTPTPAPMSTPLPGGAAPARGGTIPGSVPPPGGPIIQGTQVVAPTQTPAPAQAVSPEVQAALDELNMLTPGGQPYGFAALLNEHAGTSAGDVAFRRELMAAVGADRIAQWMGQLRDNTSYVLGLTRTLLAGATESFSLEDQGKLVQALGPQMLGEALAWGVQFAGNPLTPDREAIEVRMQVLSRMMGTLLSLPPGSPGQAEAAAALEGIQRGEPDCGAPGASTAAWIVANSGSDALRENFANGYLEAFKADPASLVPEEARAVAWALGSMTQSPTDGLGPILDLTGTQRTQFLDTLTAAEAPELYTGTHFQEAALAGVNEFLMDVARLNPGSFSNPQAANELRIEAFQKASLAVDSDFLQDSPGTHVALASMFAADTAGIIDASANTDGKFAKDGDKPLAKFFDHVAFRGEAGRSLATDALRKYLGVGPEQGIVDVLAANKGSKDFMMKQGGNALARDMGFVLGSLYQGAASAMQAMDDEHARKTAIVDVMGSLVETTIEASPVAGAYSKIKGGTGDRASVDAVFEWIGNQFADDINASKDAVTTLSGAVIKDAWAPFFGNTFLAGADPQEIAALFNVINMGVANADGHVGTPNLNIGGAYIPKQ